MSDNMCWDEKKELSKLPFSSKHTNDTIEEALLHSLGDAAKIAEHIRKSKDEKDGASHLRMAGLHIFFVFEWMLVLNKLANIFPRLMNDAKFAKLFDSSLWAHANLKPLDGLEYFLSLHEKFHSEREREKEFDGGDMTDPLNRE